ncbi:MAG: hypothetical protein LBH54_00695, partial [Clostridiales bacterium]|nr:hypothetical protein [Clostridiales bacterium]
MITVHSTGGEKIIFVNTDDAESVSTLSNRKAYVITYGFNSKATITASSVNDSHMVLCLQRAIVDLRGNEIEPQEFSVALTGVYQPEAVMLIVSVGIVSGV